MRYPELHYRWSWTLRASPWRLWPLVADTNRFNRDVGLPAVRSASAGTLANARRRLRFSRLGLRVEWEEEPFEWLRPERFGVRRRYRSGPVESLTASVTLTRTDSGGTLLVYETWMRPRWLAALVALPLAMGVFTRRAFGRAFRRYDAEALAAQTVPLPSAARVRFASGGTARLRMLARQLVDGGADAALVDKVVELVRTADEMELTRVQPYALADEWGVSRRPLLETFLRATQAGMFDLEWDVLCPLCRGAKASSARLAALPDNVHCDTCNIDLSANLEGAIELTFRVNPSIRRATTEAFCVGGPQVTPHVVAQQLLAAGESREVRLALEPGRYRLRALGLPGGQMLSVSAEGEASGEAAVAVEGWSGEETVVSTSPSLRLTNDGEAERLLILERLAWADKAVTAAEVIRLQTFRDLFSGELLRPDQEINIASLTIAFTDLRDSTRIYQEIGDAAAFSKVLDHFQVLQEEVAAEGGSLIKTIGDAVMAVFPRPVNGLKAMLRAQTRIEGSEKLAAAFSLKAGLHAGPCIAVTMNERLDYFGSVVNLASRLERYSCGKDVIVSDAVRLDPEVEEYLAQREELASEPFVAEVKGFEKESFRLWRVGRV